jgi:hypothetical protein
MANGGDANSSIGAVFGEKMAENTRECWSLLFRNLSRPMKVVIPAEAGIQRRQSLIHHDTGFRPTPE